MARSVVTTWGPFSLKSNGSRLKPNSSLKVIVEQALLKTLFNFRGCGRNSFREMGETLDRATINAYRRRLQAVIKANDDRIEKFF
ncbi:unnamed protein product [Caenorhabditis nigoni]